MYLLDTYQKVQNQELGKYLYQQKVKLLLRLSYTYDPRDKKTQQVSRICQDVASTYSASHAVREVNFVDPSVSTEDDFRFLCGHQQDQNHSLPDTVIKRGYFTTET